MKITVCTPTYNRGSLLNNLYVSLKKQSFTSFEWLIIDDGSIDDTEKIIKDFIKDGLINIKYIKKENGGKHTALNIGIDNAAGELFWIVDSDDYIVEGSLEYMWSEWTKIRDKRDFCGISGLRGYKDGRVVGNKSVGKYLDTDALSYRYKYRIEGDKSEIYKTDVLKRHKFPEFKGEKYVTEALVWNRIANQGLKLRYINKIIYICEYLEGGLTNTSDKNIIDSWQGTTLYYKEMISYSQIPFRDKIFNGTRAYLHYCYEKNIGFKGIFNITKNPIYLVSSLAIYILKLIKRGLKRESIVA